MISLLVLASCKLSLIQLPAACMGAFHPPSASCEPVQRVYGDPRTIPIGAGDTFQTSNCASVGTAVARNVKQWTARTKREAHGATASVFDQCQGRR